MDNAVRTTVYLTAESKDIIRKLAFYKNQNKTEILNNFICNEMKKEVELFEKK
jgi:hypothetical protein